MIIENIKPFVGQHCETTATGSLLYQLGIEFSEPMLFGLGEGLGFIFWKMKTMDFPFIGGRIKSDLLTENICRNLNIQLEVKETRSIKKAWSNVESALHAGKVVGLKLDCYHLDYFSSKFHFAGHYAAMYGFEEKLAYLVDTAQQGGTVQTSLKNLALARNEKGPMSSPNRSFTISKAGKMTDLKTAIKAAITRNSKAYLNPPIKNLTYKGIKKTASEVIKWFERSDDVKRDFETTAMLMERAGTGGALFRNLYRDFLKESAFLLNHDAIHEAHVSFQSIAKQWTDVSDLFLAIGSSGDVKYVHEVSDCLLRLSEEEYAAMERLFLDFGQAD